MAEIEWPENQLFLTSTTLHELHNKCKPPFEACLRQTGIDEDPSFLLTRLYLPLAAWLDRRRRERSGALVVGLSGPQGSGKSTVIALLKTVLGVGFERNVAAFSLDDIYKTRSERQAMAEAVHPLFATRGVPGTHDVDLGIETIQRLKAQVSGQSTPIPVFAKATDDRLPNSDWPHCSGPVDLVLFEGWCVGAQPQPDEVVAAPMNDLEREGDAGGAWRTAVNRALAEEYQKLFKLIDVLIMLKVDSIERVYEWRRLQEQKLAKKLAEGGHPRGQTRIMSDAELDRFIMHFERLTRHMLTEMPQRADLVLFLESTHTPTRVLINKPMTPPVFPPKKTEHRVAQSKKSQEST